jgi:hypothetical protein
VLIDDEVEYRGEGEQSVSSWHSSGVSHERAQGARWSQQFLESASFRLISNGLVPNR